jgi:hypothetical protein
MVANIAPKLGGIAHLIGVENPADHVGGLSVVDITAFFSRKMC